MTQQTKQIPVSSIILDEDIYPRKGIDHRRVGIFAENIRDGFTFDPIEVAPCPDKPGWYRLLDGAHRWSAFKSTGVEEVNAIIKNLDGNDPLLYAATKAIGPKQLTEDEARDTARRAYSRDSSLSSADIGKAIGRSRQTVDSYLNDLRASNRMGLDIKIFRLNRLGIPQDRIAKRLGLDQKTIHNHLGVDKHTFEVPKIFPDQVEMVDQGETHFPSEQFGRRVNLNANYYVFAIPFTGDGNLFHFRASTYSSSACGSPKKNPRENAC